MKIAFDFDETIINHNHCVKVQKLINILLDGGADVWIITSRSKQNVNRELYELTEILGIPDHKILFTNGAFKVNEFISGQFDLIFDNQWDEIQKINESGNCGFLINFDLFEVLEEINGHENIRKSFLGE